MAKLLYEKSDSIGWIRFNRPEVRNAFDAEEARRLVEVLREASGDKTVKAIIISGVGEAFCAGDDLKVALKEYPQIKSGEIHPILDIVEDITASLQEIPRIIRRAPKVVIAAVRGYAVGGGFEIAIDEVRIVDENDTELPPGVPGEALVRTREPWIMSNGYWNHPEWTANAFRNLWYHTGDMLMRDEDGNLYFVDRIKDAIRRRGENISSMEVENEINAHPRVLECAVIPVASEHTEQEVMAVVVSREGRELNPVELLRFLEPRLPYFMVPRYIDCVDSLPKTPTGKIQKYALRDKGITAGTWDRELAGIKLKR